MKTFVSLHGVLRRLQYSKRLIVNRRGDGVHSPFAFHFISRVVRNRRPYYCFEELRALLDERKRAGRTLPPIHRPRTLELLFRTAHELEARRILIVTSEPEESLLPDYMQRTGYTEEITLVRPELAGLDPSASYDLILLESVPTASLLEGLLERGASVAPQQAVALYVPTSKSREGLAQLPPSVTPRQQIDLIDLQLWFYDKRLTPCRCKGVY